MKKRDTFKVIRSLSFKNDDILIQAQSDSLLPYKVDFFLTLKVQVASRNHPFECKPPVLAPISSKGTRLRPATNRDGASHPRPARERS